MPLTQGQFLLWTGQQLHAEAPLYNMALAFEVRGPLDLDAFQLAFQSLVGSCDALRTVIDVHGGMPVQRILDPFAWNVEVVDLRQSLDIENAFGDWASARARRPFRLDERLTDTALVRLAADRHVWFLNQHHLITDAWSTSIIYKSVADRYARALDGTLDTAPQQPSYAAYVEYEKSARESPLARRASAYWSDQLDALPDPVSLYGARAPRVSTRTARVTRGLGIQRSKALREMATGDRALTRHVAVFNRFATLLFAYLHRVSGQNKLAFGTPSHNRPTAAFKETAGVFIEVFPLQVEVEVGETFSTLLTKVQRATGYFLRYAQPGTSMSAVNRSINVLLNYITASFPDFAGLTMASAWVHAGHGDSSHHLRLQVHDFDAAGEFVLHADLIEDLFDAPAREAAADHLVVLLDAMLADSDQRIQSAPLLTDIERDALQTTFSTSPSEEIEVPETIVRAFESQAASTPNQIAIEQGGHSLTYRQLDARANALAAQLRQRGVARGSLVAVAMGRSLEVIVTYLAVLKAGGAYVPLDPTHPEARLVHQIEEVDPVVVLTRAAVANKVPIAEAKLLVVDVDRLAEDVPAQRDRPGASDLAYVLYTSGSTGRPKGVRIGHGALAHYVAWACHEYADDAPMDAALFTPLIFDLTITSIWVPLLTGGRIKVYGEDDQPGATLLRVIEDDAVDLIKLTPSHLALLRGRKPTQRIRTVVVGGEDFKTVQATRAMDFFGQDARVWNEYGPTEATVGCIAHRYDQAVDTNVSVPIGRPMVHAEAYILNDARQLVPVGVEGELYLGGQGLAEGYLAQPERTAESFVPHPFKVGERLYRTGDLGRWRSDRTIEFLGRYDEQVKVNGVRIELGEVETALASHPGVAAAVVAVLTITRGAPEPDHYCTSCGLASTYPDITFDADGACHLCTAFATYEKRAHRYFKSMDELRAVFDASRSSATGDFDCLMLLSGGKDSTYALGQLVEMGLRVLTFTLDNGYISDEAKANIRRVTGALGVEHVFGTTPAMNAIFVDSLKRFSNVCQGCFKTIYTLSLHLARERGIPIIVTGLSRGQFFETRLTHELFEDDDVDMERIDLTVLEARKAYHRVDDAVHRLMDVEALQDDTIFDDIHFVDFYRFSDASLEEMMAYLDEKLPWVRPSDTGRSTNCLINEAGIYVHKQERGFHNYAFPYSWDVRVGHKVREEALAELDDEIDEANVRQILKEIGYHGGVMDDEATVNRLVGYYVSEEPLHLADLRATMGTLLPASMVPSAFVHLEALPISANGKVDRSALPSPETERPDLGTLYTAPKTDAEVTLAQIWMDVLRLREVGTQDNFFDLGGDSIMAIQISARAGEAGLRFAPSVLFHHQTIAELAEASTDEQVQAEQGAITGAAPLTPIQRWFFEHGGSTAHHWNQSWAFSPREPLDLDALRRALVALTHHHDALRLRFEKTPEGVHQSFGPVSETVDLRVVDLSNVEGAAQIRQLTAHKADLHGSFELSSGQLLKAMIARLGPEREDLLVLVVHHLAIDGVSWPTLIGDLETAYGQLVRQEAIDLPAKTTSYANWAHQLEAKAQSPAIRATAAHWNDVLAPADARLHSGDRERIAQTRTLAVTVRADDNVEALPSGSRIQEVLLTALAVALKPLASGSLLRVDVEGHGRDVVTEGVDVARTVGWFTSLTPFVLPLTGEDTMETFRHVTRTWRGLPPPGSYGLLRFLKIESPLDQHRDAEVLFNYLGSLDRRGSDDVLLKPVRPLELSRHPDLVRPYAIEVNAWLMNGCLEVEWSYGPRHQEAEIQKAADAFSKTLRAFSGPQFEAPPPAAFTLVNPSQMDQIAALLRGADESNA